MHLFKILQVNNKSCSHYVLPFYNQRNLRIHFAVIFHGTFMRTQTLIACSLIKSLGIERVSVGFECVWATRLSAFFYVFSSSKGIERVMVPFARGKHHTLTHFRETSCRSSVSLSFRHYSALVERIRGRNTVNMQSFVSINQRRARVRRRCPLSPVSACTRRYICTAARCTIRIIALRAHFVLEGA